MARKYTVAIVSDFTGKQIESEDEVVEITLVFPDGTKWRGDLALDEGMDMAKALHPVHKRASGRPRRPDGSFLPKDEEDRDGSLEGSESQPS